MNAPQCVVCCAASLCLLCGCGRQVYYDGIYRGSALGYNGKPVNATLVVENGSITQLVIDSSGESQGVGRDKGPALSSLLQKKGLPGRVDVISGATVTSKAARLAFRRAKRAAAGKQNFSLFETVFEEKRAFKE